MLTVGEKTIYCDLCGEQIKLTPKDIKNTVLAKLSDDEIIEKYFKCHLCGAKYTITITNRRTRELAQRRRAIPALIKKEPNPIRREELAKMDEDLKQEILELTAELKRIWGRST
ncbi:MAG: hypothetical protein Q4F79_13150 [Eubacteriales bacterium]|nr:hypothetical protein [Eubacteriales bacterium]